MSKQKKSQRPPKRRLSKKARAMIQANRDVTNKIGRRWPPTPDSLTVQKMIRQRAADLLPRL